MSTTEALRRIEELLTNLQPHIDDATFPGHAGFIDNYVDPALEIARAALAAAAPSSAAEPTFDGPQENAEGIAKHFDPVTVARWYLHMQHWRKHYERENAECGARIHNQCVEIVRLQNALTAARIMTAAPGAHPAPTAQPAVIVRHDELSRDPDGDIAIDYSNGEGSLTMGVTERGEFCVAWVGACGSGSTTVQTSPEVFAVLQRECEEAYAADAAQDPVILNTDKLQLRDVASMMATAKMTIYSDGADQLKNTTFPREPRAAAPMLNGLTASVAGLRPERMPYMSALDPVVQAINEQGPRGEVPAEPRCRGREYCGRMPFCGCGGPDPLPDRDASKDKQAQGLFRKFDVRRTDGSDAPGGKHAGCEYFVLDVTHDAFAKAALTAYAEDCRSTYPALFNDLWARYDLPLSATQPSAGEAEPNCAICGGTGIELDAGDDGRAVQIRCSGCVGPLRAQVESLLDTIARLESELAQARAAVPEAEPWSLAQIRHLVTDLVATIRKDGLDRYVIADGKALMFSNLVGACRDLLKDAAPNPPAARNAELSDEQIDALNTATPHQWIYNRKVAAREFARSILATASSADARDAARYRWWREQHEVTLITRIFGNGCVNKTIAMSEEFVDAAIAAAQKGDGHGT